MKKLIRILVVVCAFLVITSVKADEIKKEFFFDINEKVSINEDVEGSSFLAGDEVATDKKTDGIGFMFGNNVKFNGSNDYGIFGGNKVDLNGNVQKDVFVAGNEIVLADDFVVGRDMVIFASSVKINGTVNRNVLIYAGEVVLENASILGNAKITANKIILKTGTTIEGKFSYNDNAEVENNASTGSITTFKGLVKEVTFVGKAINSLIGVASLLLVFVVFVLISPSLFTRLDKKLLPSSPFLYVGKGAAFLMIVPMLVLSLILTRIGIPLAILSGVFYVIAIYLSKMFVGVVIGDFICKKYIKKEQNIFISGFIGMIILYILSFIPYLNFIVSFMTILMGLGMIVSLFKKSKKEENV